MIIDRKIIIFQVLYGDKKIAGGVIMFLTDGQEQCGNDENNPDRDDIDGGITNPELLDDIVERNIRIVTIAFGYNDIKINNY